MYSILAPLVASITVALAMTCGSHDRPGDYDGEEFFE